jgi:hypothetical protein
MLLNEYEIEFMFRKIRNIRNLGNVHIRGPHIVMSRTDAQNGLDFHFKTTETVLDNDLFKDRVIKFVHARARLGTYLYCQFEWGPNTLTIIRRRRGDYR